MKEIEVFINKIENFSDLSSGELIDFFVYYLQIEKKVENVCVKDILNCFSLLHLQPYSNVSAYLNKWSSGKYAKFLRSKNGYSLTRNRKIEIDKIVGKVLPVIPSDDLFPFVLIKNTRGYIEIIAKQALICYDKCLYDACLVMVRKLIETLIIECFERHGIEAKIKGKDGHFFFLSDLVGKILNENKWTLGRNTKNSLPKIKKITDLSAHNRRFIAKKPDIDKIQDELRTIIQELIHIIDYPNWK